MNKAIDMNRPDLFLPDGRKAASLRLGPLYREMELMGVPGLDAHMGKQELLGVYEAALLSKVEAMRRDGEAARNHPPLALMKLAAEKFMEAA